MNLKIFLWYIILPFLYTVFILFSFVLSVNGIQETCRYEGSPKNEWVCDNKGYNPKAYVPLILTGILSIGSWTLILISITSECISCCDVYVESLEHFINLWIYVQGWVYLCGVSVMTLIILAILFSTATSTGINTMSYGSRIVITLFSHIIAGGNIGWLWILARYELSN